jgi:hypothetical protein
MSHFVTELQFDCAGLKRVYASKVKLGRYLVVKKKRKKVVTYRSIARKRIHSRVHTTHKVHYIKVLVEMCCFVLIV